ncbi:hypothetical protein MRX96_051286 [Rhipicephalus microplus]
MELQTLQSQLKSAIQNHQIVLSKMRIDPQNSALQRQLHDLQAEILTLSEQQKQVVQQLRTELERKQSSAVLKLSHNAQLLPRGVLGGTGVPVKLQAALKGGPGGVLLPQVVVVPSCSGTPHGSPTLLTPCDHNCDGVTAATPAPVPTAAVAPPRKNVPLGPPPPSAPPPPKEDHQKLELLGALGLMTREALRELQHRRGERKRRTTANPPLF